MTVCQPAAAANTMVAVAVLLAILFGISILAAVLIFAVFVVGHVFRAPFDVWCWWWRGRRARACQQGAQRSKLRIQFVRHDTVLPFDALQGLAALGERDKA